MLAMLGVALLVLGIAAYTQTRFGEQQREDKNLAFVLNEADRLVATDPSLAAQLYLVANKIRPGDPDVRARLLRTQNLSLSAPIAGHAEAIYQVAFRRDGKVLASVGADRTVRLWDTADPRRPQQLGQPLGQTGRIESVEFSPDGQTMITAGIADGPRLWDVSTPESPRLIANLAAPANIRYARFSPTARIVVVAALSGHIGVWDISNPASPRPGPVLPIPEDEHVSAIAFSPDGRLLAVAGTRAQDSGHEQIRLWNFVDGVVSPVEPPVPTGTLQARTLAFSADSGVLAVGGGADPNGSLQLWDIRRPPSAPAADGQPIHLGNSDPCLQFDQSAIGCRWIREHTDLELGHTWLTGCGERGNADQQSGTLPVR